MKTTEQKAASAAYMREWRLKNVDRERDRGREKLEKNRVVINEQRRARHSTEEAKAEYQKRVAADPLFHEKNRGRAKQWRLDYPERHRDSRLQSAYGISLAQRTKMLASQNGQCAICYTPEITGVTLHVDHCHNSGKVRGLLCPQCNTALGLFRDSEHLLKKATLYLSASSQGYQAP